MALCRPIVGRYLTDVEGGIAALKALALEAPNEGCVHKHLAIFQNRAGNTAAALVEFQRYLDLNPAAPDHALIESKIAKLRTRQLRSTAQRLEAMKQAQRFDEQQLKKLIETLYSLADKDRDRYREALADIDRALRQLRQSPMDALDKLLRAARVIDP